METRRRQYRFYAQVAMLNIAVFFMFRTITLPLPELPVLSVAAPTRPQVIVPEIAQGIPTRIVVEGVGVDLPVSIGSYNPADQTWTLSDDSAYYADVSVPVNNNNGTTLIYAHAKPTIFGALTGLQPGARVEVQTENGYQFYYEYRSHVNVSPEDTSVFTESGPPTLVLQTCTGVWDEYRAMYTFEFIGEKKL